MEGLWEIRSKMEISGHLVWLIKRLYENNEASVRIEHEESNLFTAGKGVRQGCTLSPGLFNIYGEYIMREALRGWNGGVLVDDTKINNLRYADNPTVITTSKTDMLSFHKNLERESEVKGHMINFDKTKIMIIDPSWDPNATMDSRIEHVDQFVYLGALIDEDNDSTKEIRRRIRWEELL